MIKYLALKYQRTPTVCRIVEKRILEVREWALIVSPIRDRPPGNYCAHTYQDRHSNHFILENVGISFDDLMIDAMSDHNFSFRCRFCASRIVEDGYAADASYAHTWHTAVQSLHGVDIPHCSR